MSGRTELEAMVMNDLTEQARHPPTCSRETASIDGASRLVAAGGYQFQCGIRKKEPLLLHESIQQHADVGVKSGAIGLGQLESQCIDPASRVPGDEITLGSAQGAKIGRRRR